ncbi:MAG: HprK-related kinase A [Halioglobus sp.]|nr:HprK-related kinase A [Halioglobus sp.]
MTRLGELVEEEWQAQLAGEGLALRVGPYVYSIQSNVPVVHQGIAKLYADFPLASAADYVDFNVALKSRGAWQRLRGEAEFYNDGITPFERIPRGQAYAFLEWGMNWCVALHTNEYLKLHAAVVTHGDRAVIMPGIPGAGKSTLCAALGLRGWRVLSDEHAMIPPGRCAAVPVYRPVSLKNESIAVIRQFAPEAVFGPRSEETHKGVVCHVKADLAPDSHATDPLPVGALVFPRYQPGAPQRLAPRRKTESFILAAYHSFNYSLLGEKGFEAMRTLVENTHCYDLNYHDLDWAVNSMNQLADEGMPS